MTAETAQEFEFVLPHGYVDAQGIRHRSGTIRMATARDELAPVTDQRVRENPSNVGVVQLSLVVTRLGTITDIHPGLLADLSAGDLAYLQEMYERINAPKFVGGAVCPTCGGPAGGAS
ncbi:hypothetical protein [Streptomyces sp. NPDC051211]|uniref:hypothetical protein n=1 Tax=Streptomyces sp. NPDC051211 TaxID=3154643 RepID=UPI00344CD1A0